jgi:hypothetical protein
MTHKQSGYTSRQTKIIFIVIGLLILIRALMPLAVKKFVNTQLSQIDPYEGHVERIELFLFTGRYVVRDMTIVKKDAGDNEPFVIVPRSDLVIQWKPLFKGYIVGEVRVLDPVINFVFAQEGGQTGEETDWVELVDDLIPIEINEFVVQNGDIMMRFERKDFSLETALKQLELNVTNIRNIVNPEEDLPSRIRATAFSPTYSGQLHFEANANLMRVIPDMDYNLEFENVELTALNPIMKYATNMDFESGTLDFYSEMIVKDGTLDGYVKPILTDARIYSPKEEGRGFLTGVKEFLAEGAQEILENNKVKTSATRIPVAGTIEDVKTSFWPTVIGFLRNAYWQALLKKIDDSVDYKVMKAAERVQEKRLEQ